MSSPKHRKPKRSIRILPESDEELKKLLQKALTEPDGRPFPTAKEITDFANVFEKATGEIPHAVLRKYRN